MSEKDDFSFAAKAVGIKIAAWGGETAWIEIPSEMEFEKTQLCIWNPRADDDSAFRLLLAIRGALMPYSNDSETWCVQTNMFRVLVSGELDRAKAFREAIFRAAIEIGKRMP